MSIKRFITITIELGFLAAAGFLLWQKFGNVTEVRELLPETVQEQLAPKLPQTLNPQEQNFKWQLAGKNYSLKQTLYKSYLDFYQKLPKTYSYAGALPTDWEEQYFGMFVHLPEGDATMRELTEKIQQLSLKNKLTEDQTLELTLAFVQSIPYDDAKARVILSKAGGEGGLPNYPYETLFENKGVCSDKSFLFYLLARQLGYGVTLMTFEEQNHMAVGIECPRQYSFANTGYCFAETTAPNNKLGIVPQFDIKTGRAAEVKELDVWQVAPTTQILGTPKIFQAVRGREYLGIIQTQKDQQAIAKLQQELGALSQELSKQKELIDQQETQLKQMTQRLNDLAEKNKVEQYNKLVGEYNDLAKNQRTLVEKYNRNVALYNQKVKQYNSLVGN